MSSIITDIADFASIVGALVSVLAAFKAFRVKKAVELDFRQITLSDIEQSLTHLQSELNALENAIRSNRRGFKIGSSLSEIQRHLDGVLNRLSSDGPDRDIRAMVSAVQGLVSELGQSDTDHPEIISKMRTMIQEGISTAKSRVHLRLHL